MKLMKARQLSAFTELAGKGRETLLREKQCPESKSRVFDLEDIYWMAEQRFAGWIGARNNDGRTPEVRKSTIPLQIVLSVSNRNPDKRRFRISFVSLRGRVCEMSFAASPGNGTLVQYEATTTFSNQKGPSTSFRFSNRGTTGWTEL
jgi:hypothetical protein